LGGGLLGAAVISKEVGNGRNNRFLAVGGIRGIVLCELVLLVLVEGVHVCAGKFAGRNLLGEEEIEFVEGAVLKREREC
jgi:hypothetical protein